MSKDIQVPDVHGLVLTIRGKRVILDADLARLYEVPGFRFNEAVKRNADRFPTDFRFRLLRQEFAALKMQATDYNVDTINSSQIAMSSFRQRGAKYLPWAFTEHGCLMAATVLNSPRAVQMSLFVIRAFVSMRAELTTGAAILKRLAEIDRTLLEHDGALRAIWRQLQPLLQPPPEPPKRRIGFLP